MTGTSTAKHRPGPAATLLLAMALSACSASVPDAESSTSSATSRTVTASRSATASSESASPTLRPGLTAVAHEDDAGLAGRLLQFRRDEAGRRLQVRLTAANAGLIVEALELRAPDLTARPASPREARLRSGAALDIPVVMGAVDCGVAPGQAVAKVGLRDDSGQRRTVEVPLDDDGLLRRLHETDCAEQSLRAQAALRVAAVESVTTADGPALRVLISLSRVGGSDPVRVTGTDPNTVYDVKAVDPLPTLRGSAPVTFRVDMVPARCDTHALGESYRTSLIGLRMALGTREPQPVVLTPDAGTRRRLETFAVDTCLAGGH